jgi:histidinol-phosphate aminotransferase
LAYNPIPDRGPGLRLHLNENTAGCSPAVLAAIRSLGREDMAFYPDYEAVTSECERWLKVAAGWVQLTNGLDEGLHVVAQFARGLTPLGESRVRPLGRSSEPDSPLGEGRATVFDALIVEPAFEMYAACTEAVGGSVIRVAPEPDFRFPLEALLAKISERTRLVYLTDPNNPTGLAIPPDAVEKIADAAPHALVLLDEAYADFSGRTLIGAALERHRNLIVGRTFAKAHGLAALRVGALVAHPDTLEPLRKILPPYTLNVCAVRALSAALGDPEYLNWYVDQSARSRELLYGFCKRHDFHYWLSEANFVLIRVGPAATAITDALALRGVFIRDRSGQPGCAGCVRITAGVAEHTQTCLTALEDILASIGH